ncbi:MAG: helix-turn-helix transcriptional regulator [Spirosoma sp.]|nr:helix-turn-helix transcriptional regulator [Spirosoma sp.]
MSIEQSFGELLKTLRERHGISQEKLAEKSDLHRTYISLLERGIRQPSLTTIFKIANALSLSPSEVISELEKLLTKQNENS